MSGEDGSGVEQLSSDPALRAIQLEEAKANRDLALASALKGSAEAEKAATDAKSAADSAASPAPTTKAPEGKVEVGEKTGLVADLVAHAMIRRAAEQISNEIPKQVLKAESRVLLVSSPDLIGSDWPYMSISEQIEHHRAGLEAILPGLSAVDEADLAIELNQAPFFGMEATIADGANLIEAPEGAFAALAAVPPLAPLQAVSSAIGGVADIVSMFRSDYGITARDVSIGATPLLAALARFLVPRVDEVNVDGFSLLKKSELFAKFNAAAKSRLDLQVAASRLKETKVAPFEQLTERAKEARTAYNSAVTAEHAPTKPVLTDMRKRAEKFEAELAGAAAGAAAARTQIGVAEAAVQRFDSFAGELLKAPEGGYPPIVAAAIRERLHADSGYTHVIYAGVESAGGESISRRTIFKSSMRFMGGATATFLIWDVSEEKLVTSDTIPFLGEIKMRLGSGFKDGVESRFLR